MLYFNNTINNIAKGQGKTVINPMKYIAIDNELCSCLYSYSIEDN